MAATGTVANVSPGIGGSVYWADLSTTLKLPTTANAELGTDFKSLGYVSEDGVKQSIDNGAEFLNVWGKRNLKLISSEKEHTVTFTLIEPMNVEVRKLVYNDSDASTATATLKGGITSITAHAFVFSMVMEDGSAKRLVLPNAFVTEIGEITYSDTETIGYEITLTAAADDSGNSMYDYYTAKS